MATKTREEALAWVLDQKGKLLPFGGYSQCVAFVRNYVAFLGYKQPPSVEGAKDLATVTWGLEFTRTINPQPGDIGVLSATQVNKSGHTDIVVDYRQGSLVTFDQNLVNPKLGGSEGSPVAKVTWVYPNSRFIAFYRPNFKESTVSKEADINSGDFENIAINFGGTPDAFNKATNWHDVYYGAMAPRITQLRTDAEKWRRLVKDLKE